MTDPQLPPPVPQAPRPPFAQPGAAPAPPQAVYSPPPPGAYLAPAAGYQSTAGAYMPPPAPQKGSALGVVALVLALLALLVPGVIAGVTGFAIGAGVDQYALEFGDGDDLAFLSPVRQEVLIAELTFWAGTMLGIWAIVQGAIASRRRQGRGPGIAAIIVAVVAGIAYVGIGALAFFAGLSSTLVMM